MTPAPRSVVDQRVAGHVARQPVEHAGLDHRLGDEEHVRRTRAGQAGDRVERWLGAHHDDRRPRRAAARASRGRASLACVPPAIADDAPRTSAGVFGIARTTGRPGADGLERGDRDAGRDRQHERVGLAARSTRRSSTAATSRRLHRDHHDVGVGDGPRRAGHDAHAGEERLELVPAVGVDLGDRERLGLPAGVEQAADQRRAHASAAEQCDAFHPAEANGARPSAVRRPPIGTGPGPDARRARGTLDRLRTSPNGAASCTSGPRCRSPVGGRSPARYRRKGNRTQLDAFRRTPRRLREPVRRSSTAGWNHRSVSS